METLRFAFFALILIFVAGCASTDSSNPQADNVELARVIEASSAQNEVGRSSGYYSTLARHWTQYQLPAKGNCFPLADRSNLYLQIESDGEVSKVYGDPSNAKSKCYEKAYTGMTVPKPPVSPFFFKLDIQ